MSEVVKLTVDGGLATMRLGREHGNAINSALVEGLLGACERAVGDPSIRGVLLAASGKLFCPGLDLVELIELDRPEMERFLEAFSRSMVELYALEKPVVAALHGHAIAGGCILSLTADWRVLCEGVMVGLNEVRVGVPFPFGVSMMLREAVLPSRLEEIALFGRNYAGEEAVATGLVHELVPRAGFEDHCLERLAELAGKDANALAITKRYLRAATVERIRARDRELAPEFLDAWFSPSTRERIRAIVADLKK